MQDRVIAHAGLCAAAAVFAASLGVLIFQGSRSSAAHVRSLEPAQIQSAPSVGSMADRDQQNS